MTDSEHTCTLADARYYANRLMPYLGRGIFVMEPIETEGLGTFAVDKFWRLYYDPEVAEKWDLDEMAGVVLHETFHLLFHHHKRFELVCPNPTDQDRQRWNIAADLSINCILANSSISLPKGSLQPHQYDFETNLTAEEYYEMLERQDIPGPSYDPDVELANGSAVDGEQKSWELDPPEKDDINLDDNDEKRIRRAMAKEIQQKGPRGRGDQSGEIGALITRLIEPAIDPVYEIFAAVKYAVNSIHGYGQQSFKKRNPRQPKGTLRLPSNSRPVPEVRILIDTSGSMHMDTDLALAAGVVAKVIAALPREGVQVSCADTQVTNTEKVFRADQIRVIGRGGTRMDDAIETVDEDKPHPDVIVCITDGETAWPSEPTKAKLIVCLTNSNGSSAPDWAVELSLTN